MQLQNWTEFKNNLNQISIEKISVLYLLLVI